MKFMLIKELESIHAKLAWYHNKQSILLTRFPIFNEEYVENGFAILELEREASEILWKLADLKEVVPSPNA